MARQGARYRTEHLELRSLPSPRPHPRVGLIVPKHGHPAVARNQLKRRLREIIRCQLLSRLPSIDLVVRARREAYDAPVPRLTEEITRAGRRLITPPAAAAE